MTISADPCLPAEQQQQLKKAVVLEWITIAWLLPTTVIMYLAMGSSQAMKTAWIEDALSLVPPISFLIAARFRNRQPSDKYPYGFRRATLLSFLVAGVAVLVLGLYLLFDSVTMLFSGERPSLGHFSLFGQAFSIWSGWIMIIALIYSLIPPLILGRMKETLAEQLNEKTLHADATMNKADWMTAGAATLGVLGIGIGWWWADAVAAAFISLSIVKDGFSNVSLAARDLMNQRPTDARGKPLDIEERLRQSVLEMHGVENVEVRLHNEGDLVSGEVLVKFTHSDEMAMRLQEISQKAQALDWRLHELRVIPVTSKGLAIRSQVSGQNEAAPMPVR
jgi:cation diffusion facilitator family transporter